jgi:hypothetical protein
VARAPIGPQSASGWNRFKDCEHFECRSGAKYSTTLIIAPAHISVLNDVFAWSVVPLIAVGHF